MKAMTCKQLGGACDEVFQAETFEQMADLSKQHGTKMFEIGDKAHLQAMEEIKLLMESPQAMQEWFDGKRKEFDASPEVD